MYANPAPMIDVVIQSDPAPWWQIVAAVGPYIVIFLVEIVCVVLLLRGTRRNKTSSRIDWEQMRWALDASVSEDARRAKMGRSVLGALSLLQLSKNDRELLQAASNVSFNPVEEEPPESAGK